MSKQIILYTEIEKNFKNGIEQIENAGIGIVEVYSPIPIHTVQTKKAERKTYIPAIGLIFGILGAIGGFYLQYWVNMVAYPLNFGGKPLLAIPSFIPAIFECAVLCSALAMSIVFLTSKKNKNQTTVDILLSEDKYIVVINKNELDEEKIKRFAGEDTFKLKIMDLNE